MCQELARRGEAPRAPGQLSKRKGTVMLKSLSTSLIARGTSELQEALKS